jgi:hypothetical protein
MVKVLSVQQPFAWAILQGLKKVENRSKLTHHRGPLLIHSGKSRDRMRSTMYYVECDYCGAENVVQAGQVLGACKKCGQPSKPGWGEEELAEARFHDGTLFPPAETLVFGAILGMVRLVDCLELPAYEKRFGKDPFARGPFCWVLENPQPFKEPFPCGGQVGLWNSPAALVQRLKQQCSATA